MKNTKIIYMFTALAAAAALLLAACASAAAPAAAASIDSTAAPDDLDEAIRGASDYLTDNIPSGSRIVILNIQSGSEALSEYILDELIANAVNDKVFTVVDWQQYSYMDFCKPQCQTVQT